MFCLMAQVILSILPVVCVSNFLPYKDKTVCLLLSIIASCVVYIFFSKQSFYKLKKGNI